LARPPAAQAAERAGPLRARPWPGALILQSRIRQRV